MTRDLVVDFSKRNIDFKYASCFYPLRNENLNPMPTVYYSKATFYHIGRHIEKAQNLLNKPRILHYLGSTIAARANRSAALAPVRNKDPGSGNSWDEYPFASTQEGGQGASVQAVPISEQSDQAKLMRSFTSKLKPGDPFRVEVTN